MQRKVAVHDGTAVRGGMAVRGGVTARDGATVRHEDVGHDDLTVRHERDFSELHHDRDRCMAPARPLLRTIREKAVVASNGREAEVADGILRHPCLDEGLPDRTAEIEHAGIPRVDPTELRAKTLHELLGDLVFVTEDMRTDICPNGACRACCGLAQDARSFGRDTGDRPLPSRMNDREPAWAGEHNRHAVGEAQHHRDMRGDAHNGIGTLGYLLAHAGELIIRALPNDGDAIAVHLVGHEQPLEIAGAPERREHAAAILHHGSQVVPHMGTEVQRAIRRPGSAARALGKRRINSSVAHFVEHKAVVVLSLIHI